MLNRLTGSTVLSQDKLFATLDPTTRSYHLPGGRGMTITDPVHVAAAKVLREQFQRPRPAPDPHTELVRDLADYDRAFGLIDGPVDGEEVA